MLAEPGKDEYLSDLLQKLLKLVNDSDSGPKTSLTVFPINEQCISMAKEEASSGSICKKVVNDNLKKRDYLQ